MNVQPRHIKYGCRLAVLTLSFLLAVLHSPAQHHRKRHEHRSGGLPDSVSTSDEDIQPFNADTLTAKVRTPDTAVVSNAVGEIDQKKDTAVNIVEAQPPVLRSIPDSVISNWKKSREFAYANDPSWWKDETEPQRDNGFLRRLARLLSSDGFRYFIYILLGSVLLYALYRIISENNLRFFYRAPSRLRETALGEAGLPEEDLDVLLKKALAEKDHRQATRYLYLKTLRLLDARQLIRWHIQATDEEYARQLDKLPQGERFRWLTAAYERVWYGKFPINEGQFSRLSQSFQDFHISIGQTGHS